MTIVKSPLQRIVTISLDATNTVTHSWQQTLFAVMEDGLEISRTQSAQEHLDPADIGAAVPQAGVLAQLAALKTSTDAAAVAAAKELADSKAAAEAVRADLQSKLDAANVHIALLTAAHDAVTAKNAAAVAALA